MRPVIGPILLALSLTSTSGGSAPSPEPKFAVMTRSASVAHARGATLAYGRVGYDRGFFIESHDETFRLKLQGRLQLWASLDVAEEVTEASFDLARARLEFSGHAYTKRLDYMLEVAFERGFVELKDAYADLTFVKRMLILRAGQMKRPFWRQHLVGEGDLVTSDYAIDHKWLDNDRDLGLMLHDDIKRSPSFEYALGVFAGPGTDPVYNGSAAAGRKVDISLADGVYPQVVLRLGYNRGKVGGYDEGQFIGGSKLRLALGTALAIDVTRPDDQKSRVQWAVDAVLELYGLQLRGAAFLRSDETDGFFGRSLESMGGHVTLCHATERFVYAMRYAWVVPETPNDDRFEITGAITGLIFGNDVKAMLEGRVLIEETETAYVPEYRVRIMGQVGF